MVYSADAQWGSPRKLECEGRVVVNRLSRITIDDAQCGGRPCIRGMRIRVSDILGLLGAGATVEEILADYPYLEREDILACVESAARQTDHLVLRSA